MVDCSLWVSSDQALRPVNICWDSSKVLMSLLLVANATPGVSSMASASIVVGVADQWPGQSVHFLGLG